MVKKAVSKSSPSHGQNGNYLLYNPGGPGTSSVSNLESMVPLLYNTTGGDITDYTFVAVDPRAVGGSTLHLNCTISDEDTLENVANSLNPNLPPQFTNEDSSDRETAYNEVDNYLNGMKTIFTTCAENSPYISYIGAYYQAQDLAYVIDTISGSKETKINYYGFSYGTYLGQTLSEMFANRIGSILLDGVVSPVQTKNILSGVDEAYDAFIQTCIDSSPEACPIKQLSPNITRVELIQLIDGFADSLFNEPADTSSSGLNTRTQVYSTIYEALYTQSKWYNLYSTIASIAQQRLNQTADNNVDTDQNVAANQNVAVNDQLTSNGLLHAINCADIPGKTVTTDSFLEMLAYTQENVSSRFYSQMIGQSQELCGLFPKDTFNKKHLHIYDQVFNNTILLATNTGDPITPLDRAEDSLRLLTNSNSSSFKENAKLFVTKGVGHTTTPGSHLFTDCIKEVYNDYFVYNNLPDKTCEVNTDDYVKYVELYAANKNSS